MNSKLNKSNKLNLWEIMIKKKILSIVMVLCLCLGFMSVSVLASELPEAGDLEVEAVAGDGEITVTWNKLEGSNISYTVYYYIDEDYEGTYKECTGEPSYVPSTMSTEANTAKKLPLLYRYRFGCILYVCVPLC